MAPPTPIAWTVMPTSWCRIWGFSSQDYHLKQPQKTLVYVKALQHWVDLAKPTPPGESYQLMECIKKLREWMEPFTTSTDAEVFNPVEPSNWVQITPCKSAETAELSLPQECSNGKNCRTRARGIGSTRGIGHSTLTIPSAMNVSSIRSGAPNISTQWVKTPLGSRHHCQVLQKLLSPCREMTPPE